MFHEGRSERIGQKHIEMILIESMCNFYFILYSSRIWKPLVPVMLCFIFL